MDERGDTVVYRLGQDCDLDDLEEGKIYEGVVQGFANFGIFVQLNNRLRGLVHKSNVMSQHRERDPVLVEVLEIRSNGNIDLRETVCDAYQISEVVKKRTTTSISDLGSRIGRYVHIDGEIAQIKQTSGPTIFTLVDESGTLNAAAFVEAGVRAYPEVGIGDIVSAAGEIMQRNNQLQLEVKSLSRLEGADVLRVRDKIEQALDERSEPPEVPFLIRSDLLERLKPEMRKVARYIRRAVFTAQPIILRHHADADGISAAVAIEQAVTALIRENGADFDGEYYLFKRAPSKAPFYEIEDITRDLDFALKDRVRFGQKLPLIIQMDNGSTEEDEPALMRAQVYGLQVVVVDHHHPDEVVDKYLVAHVNPYHAGGDFGMTAGMLGTEIARMINPSVEENIRHLPAVAAVGDRSEAEERGRYLDLVKETCPEEWCMKIALALDYQQFWLRFNDGREIIKDILNLNGDPELHRNLVNLLVEGAERAIEMQVEAVMPHIEARSLPNGAWLFQIDVEMFAHRFTFPPPGKTSGEVHDRLCQKYKGDPVVTIGFGPDFAVLRSRGVLMNIPVMVRELRDEIAGGGVTGGGHLVVGSIKFLEGMREEVLKGLTEKIGEAPIEE